LIAVLDYGIGNLRSAQKALEKVGAEVKLTYDPEVVADADGVVLPGVGAFGRCMRALRAARLEEPAKAAIGAGVPFLGVCVGMQMLYRGSEEDPDVPGMGVLDGGVGRVRGDVKLPQMQWNTLDRRRDSAMLEGLAERPWVYFVHSYAPQVGMHAVATCDYGGPVWAAVERDTLWATQFHPEKSGLAGLRLLANFVALTNS
jgi:glutamine amidotransferase